MRTSTKFLAGLAAFALAGAASAGVVRISEGDFTPDAGLITFSEFGIGTNNPFYTPADYGGSAGQPDVSFDGYFLGQMLSGDPANDCPAASPSGCVVGNPTGPLALDPAAPNTVIVNDGANPTSPVLSGSPTFNGPIGILFSVDLAGVGLDGGFFDAIGGTAITAFDRDGNNLGSIANEGFGIEFLGLATDDGTAQIAGLLFSLVGGEPAGYAIDNLQFALEGQVVVDAPEPGTLALLGLGLVGVGMRRRKS